MFAHIHTQPQQQAHTVWALFYSCKKSHCIADNISIVILDATQVSFLPGLKAINLTCAECVWLWVGRLKGGMG